MALLDTIKRGISRVGSVFDRVGPTYVNPSSAPKVSAAPTAPSAGAVSLPNAAPPATRPAVPAATVAKAAVAPTLDRLRADSGTTGSAPVPPPSFTVQTSGTAKSTDLGPTSRADALRAAEDNRAALEARFAPTREQERARQRLDEAERALAAVTAGEAARLADLRYYNPEGVFGGGQATVEGQISRESTLQAIQAQGALSAAQSAYDRLDAARQQEIQNYQTIQSLTMPEVIGTPTVNKSTGEVTAYLQNPDGTVSLQSIGNVGPDESFDLQSVIRNEATGQAFAVGTRNGELVAEPLAGTAGVKPTAGTATVGGLSTKPLSGDAAKVYGFASTMVPEIEQLKQLFQNDFNGTLRGAIFGTNANVNRLIDSVADKVGRLRSGGAVNKDEEARFRAAIARKSDLLFGSPEATIAALDRYAAEARTVLGGVQSGLAGAEAAASSAPAASQDPLDALLNDLGY